MKSSNHLSRLEFFTEIPDEDEEEPTMEIVNESIQNTSKTVNNTNYIATPHIAQVESELGNLRSELKSISLALC